MDDARLLRAYLRAQTARDRMRDLWIAARCRDDSEAMADAARRYGPLRERAKCLGWTLRARLATVHA